MIRYLLVWLLVLVPAVSGMAQTGQPTFLETFKPVERVHDFGAIYERDGLVSHVFTLRNTGKKPVAISAVNTWCGCMVADYTRRAVRPGETARVTVSLDPDHKQGNFAKQVVVLLNDGKQYVRLWIKAHIIPCLHPVEEDHPYSFGHGLWMSQQILPFPCLRVGQQYTYELKVANDTDKPMTVRFKRMPNNTVLKMPEMVRLKPRERTAISVSYDYLRTYKVDRYIYVVPIVNGKEAKPLTIRWNAGKRFRLL